LDSRCKRRTDCYPCRACRQTGMDAFLFCRHYRCQVTRKSTWLEIWLPSPRIIACCLWLPRSLSNPPLQLHKTSCDKSTKQRPQPFYYRDRGSMITIGRNAAGVAIGSRTYTGFLPGSSGSLFTSSTSSVSGTRMMVLVTGHGTICYTNGPSALSFPQRYASHLNHLPVSMGPNVIMILLKDNQNHYFESEPSKLTGFLIYVSESMTRC